MLNELMSSCSALGRELSAHPLLLVVSGMAWKRTELVDHLVNAKVKKRYIGLLADDHSDHTERTLRLRVFMYQKGSSRILLSLYPSIIIMSRS